MGKTLLGSPTVRMVSPRYYGHQTEVYLKHPLPIAATSWSACGSLREGPASQLKSSSGLLSCVNGRVSPCNKSMNHKHDDFIVLV